MKSKYLFVGFLVLLNILGYSYEGYFSQASLVFNCFYFATLLISAYILSKIDVITLLKFSVAAFVLGVCVEFINTEALNWTYFNGGQPPLFVAMGWIFLIALIFYGSKIFKKYNYKYPVLPSLVCFFLFFLFSYKEGNIGFLTIGLYLIMAFTGIYFSFSSSSGWNTGILLMGIIIGSVSEFLGASCHLWSFRSGALLPLPMVVAWSANAFCLQGLLKLLHLPPEDVFG
ncbi:MAG: hypothetical protein HXS44_09480 [Theionarchaea archaeon]|nr:hypothetical protein [Theionarchaea archaeon]